jgi:hypothetical protein
MTKRKEAVEGAVRAELRPCATCGKFVLFHLLRRQDRLEINPHDDNHVFRPVKASARQMRLPFDVIVMGAESRGQEKSSGKKPCRRAIEVGAGRRQEAAAEQMKSAKKPRRKSA